jgi:hypothetical protein
MRKARPYRKLKIQLCNYPREIQKETRNSYDLVLRLLEGNCNISFMRYDRLNLRWRICGTVIRSGNNVQYVVIGAQSQARAYRVNSAGGWESLTQLLPAASLTEKLLKSTS